VPTDARPSIWLDEPVNGKGALGQTEIYELIALINSKDWHSISSAVTLIAMSSQSNDRDMALDSLTEILPLLRPNIPACAAASSARARR
jgi:hypothetical protein